MDLNRTVEKQLNQLVGQVDKVFGSQVDNHRAAVETIIGLFSEIETKYSTGNIAKLLDNTKRVSSEQIENAFELITTKSKCFDYWRNQKREVSKALKIKPVERAEFEFSFSSSFDFFKSITEAKHRGILDFVKTNIDSCQSFTEEEIVVELFLIYKKSKSITLGEIRLKAIIFAAVFETILKRQE